jgi:hypothetical protein
VEHGITCKCVWIPGRQLIRQGADPLSRGAFPFKHCLPSRREVFGPYHDVESNIPPFLHRLVESHAPPIRPVHHPADWCHTNSWRALICSFSRLLRRRGRACNTTSTHTVATLSPLRH